MLKLIIGLGNPGADYTATRHNAGFWFLDALAQREQAVFSPKSKFKAEVAAATGTGGGIYLFKPQTFMNLSGETAIAAANFYQAEGAQVLVAHDDVDFPPGIARLKQGGGSAGHRGLADITRRIGGGYWRLRIGVGRPAQGGVEDYVLRAPAAAERQQIDDAIAAALGVWDILLAGDYNNAMKTLHTAAAPAPAAPAASAAPTAAAD